MVSGGSGTLESDEQSVLLLKGAVLQFACRIRVEISIARR